MQKETVEPATTRQAPKQKKGAMETLTSLKAAAIDHFGPPEVLKLHTLSVPELGPREVLIAVDVAGVGFWDAKIRDGTWASDKVHFPLVLGTDGTGTVVARGALVRRFTAGDKVWAYQYENPKGGFYAEYVAVDADHVAHVPEGLDLLQAGAGSVTGLTALQGIDDVLKVRKGETVLIFGASGGVGTLAIQFAKRRQARVIGTATGSDATSLVRELGADEVIDPRSGDAIEQLQALAPKGINAILALAGGETLEQCIDLLPIGGRVAYPNGVEPEPKKRKGVIFRSYNGEVGPRQFAHLERAIGETGLHVPVAEIFSLKEAAKAHARLEKGHVLGRIVLRISRESGEELLNYNQ